MKQYLVGFLLLFFVVAPRANAGGSVEACAGEFAEGAGLVEPLRELRIRLAPILKNHPSGPLPPHFAPTLARLEAYAADRPAGALRAWLDSDPSAGSQFPSPAFQRFVDKSWPAEDAAGLAPAIRLANVETFLYHYVIDHPELAPSYAIVLCLRCENKRGPGGASADALAGAILEKARAEGVRYRISLTAVACMEHAFRDGGSALYASVPQWADALCGSRNVVTLSPVRDPATPNRPKDWETFLYVGLELADVARLELARLVGTGDPGDYWRAKRFVVPTR